MDTSEQATFDKSRQPPLDEMLDILALIKKTHYGILFGGVMSHRTDHYAEIQFHLERVSVLKEHGWDYVDFQLALEKRSIVEQINEHNENIKFPDELVERAKRFFPNAKFTQAKIEF